MKRAVAYLRVSTKDQAEGGYSLDGQRDACVRYIADKGWELVEVYVDAGESARTADRPEFQRMLRDLKQGRDDGDPTDFVVVHKLDRFARNTRDHVFVRLTLYQMGVRLASVMDDLNDTPGGKLIENISAAINQFESDKGSVNVRMGMGRKAKEGMYPTVAPIGYINHREDGNRKAESRLLVNPIQGPLVSEAFELYATGQLSITDLHEIMVEKGLRTRTGNPPQRSALAKILKREMYTGEFEWQGEDHIGSYEPLVKPEVFDRVQQILGEHGRVEVRKRVYYSYLRGSVFCDSCGSRLSDDQHHRNSTVNHYLFCLRRHAIKTQCHEPYIPLQQAEHEIESVWWKVFLPSQVKARMQDEIVAIVERRLGDEAYREAKVLRIEQLKREQQRFVDAFVADAIDVDQLKLERAKRQSEIENLERQLASNEELLQAPAIIDRMFQKIENLTQAYLGAKGPIRRSLNQAVFLGFWFGGQHLRRHEFHPDYADFVEVKPSNSELMVDPRGFEPLTF